MKSILTPEEQVEAIVLHDIKRSRFPVFAFERRLLCDYAWDNVSCRPEWKLPPLKDMEPRWIMTRAEVDAIVERKLKELKP